MTLDDYFDFTHEYMDALSQLYSTEFMTTIVYLPHNAKHLTALIYLPSPNINYHAHLDYIANTHNLTNREHINKILVSYTDTPPHINDYINIRLLALRKFEY